MEKHLVIDHVKFSYEGLFNPAELYNVVAQWFYDKGWDWWEKKNQEMSLPSGKQIYLILEPWKSVSDYYKLQLKLKIIMIDMKEVEVEHDGKPVKLMQGVVRMTIDGWLLSDREKKWNNQPILWFLSFVLEKYFFKRHFEKFVTWLKSDADDVYTHVKNYLNTFKYTYQH
ncbi:MAG TPA: hypothetical protein VJI98_03750 [Candidatus Nanoarchaeia archaeon]|nr:hypothetical protein [Candidatus Nanoarchaeia archaeon]